MAGTWLPWSPKAIDPDFYLRAITVRWPFLIARPAPSNRISDKRLDPERLSPTGTTPARKLIVNWGWGKLEGSVSQLRFLCEAHADAVDQGHRAVTVRLTLKESGWPRRRIVVKVKSNISYLESRPPHGNAGITACEIHLNCSCMIASGVPIGVDRLMCSSPG